MHVLSHLAEFRKYLLFSFLFTLGVVLCSSYVIIYHRYLITIFMEDPLSRTCSCRRPSFYPRRKWIRLNSTCSDVGTFFDEGQNVVSYSMHLEQKESKRAALYRRGISENLARMRKYYPGFSMRIYSDEELTMDSDFCEFWCQNADLFWCDVRRSPSLGNISGNHFTLWRFAPMGDPTVEAFLSRDLDSVITPREAGAVKEWLNSSKPFHAMRDNPKHAALMLAGMWGARNGLLESNVSSELRSQLIDSGGQRFKDSDQLVLDNVFGSRMCNILVHDSYLCREMALTLGSTVLPFPTKRLNNANDFVGNPEFGAGNYSLPPCPVECRPSYGKDWTYC